MLFNIVALVIEGVVMDSYGSSSSPSAPSSSELMDQLKTQLAQAYAEEFLEVLFFLNFNVVC